MDLKTVFVIAVTTSRMIMPGMPEMPKIPGMKMPAIGAPTRELKMDLTSDKNVNKSSKAQCAIPEGLKLGPKVDLIIDLPVKTEPGVSSEGIGKSEKQGKFVMKFYWMCAEVVPKGQPRIMDSEKMMNAAGSLRDNPQMKQMMNKSRQMQADWSHAYWPGGENPIKDDSQHCPGAYTLTTNYCGGTDITLDKSQDFLAPIELISPGKGNIDLSKTIKVDWKPVPNALAYILTAFAGKENEMVSWTSSGDPDVTVDFANTAMSPAEVKKYIDKGILLPPDKTSCRIPTGIFQGFESPMLMVTAIGTDKFQQKDNIETHVTVRSNANVMLTDGMDMGNMEDAENVEQDKPATDANDDSNVEEAIDDTNDAANTVNKAKSAVDRLKGVFKRK